jgi:hypothetical protein
MCGAFGCGKESSRGLDEGYITMRLQAALLMLTVSRGEKDMSYVEV